MRNNWDVIVVGLGLAGLNAARHLGARGLRILLLDENNVSGGQYLRRAMAASAPSDGHPLEALKSRGFRLIEACQGNRFEIRTGYQVLGAESDGLVWGLDSDGRLMEDRAEYVILACGARERFLPFPGWTLPGVVSCGGAQIMLKTSGVLPGRQCVVGGSGPLPLALAGEITGAGARVRAFWDQSSLKDGLRGFRFFPGHASKIALGARYLARLALARTRILHSRKILEVRGNRAAESVALARTDEQGRTIVGSETILPIDCLAVGYGFVSNIELAQAAGCRVICDRDKGGFVVDTDEMLQTSLSRFLAAGEVTGVAGAHKSFIEGALAGATVAFRMGRLNEARYNEKLIALTSKRQSEMAFGAFLNRLSLCPPELLNDLPDRTIICRCEEITLGDIRRRIKDGFTSLDALKKSTSSAMGMCQGRNCGPILKDVLETCVGLPAATLAPLSVRAPIKPVPLSALADLEPEPRTG